LLLLQRPLRNQGKRKMKKFTKNAKMKKGLPANFAQTRGNQWHVFVNFLSRMRWCLDRDCLVAYYNSATRIRCQMRLFNQIQHYLQKIIALCIIVLVNKWIALVLSRPKHNNAFAHSACQVSIFIVDLNSNITSAENFVIPK
jgi:hypothetical protein